MDNFTLQMASSHPIRSTRGLPPVPLSGRSAGEGARDRLKFKPEVKQVYLRAALWIAVKILSSIPIREAIPKMTTLKIVIPMAGLGKRLLPLTGRRPKPLMRLTDKRLLDHVLDSLRTLETRYSLEYIFIVGYRGEQIRVHMQEAHPDKKVTYYVQHELMGQSHAVHLAKDALAGPLLLTYCDTINIIDYSSVPLETMEGIAWVLEIEDPRRHGVALVGSDSLITKLVEKPRTMEHKLALTGIYYFSEGKDLITAIENSNETRNLIE